MKKILLLLMIVLLIGCGENRILVDELTNKGTWSVAIMYYEGELFNGIGYDIYSNGQLKSEVNYKDGKMNGLLRAWFRCIRTIPKQILGQLKSEVNYKDGKMVGLYREFWENGQLFEECDYVDGIANGIQKRWNEDGSFQSEGKVVNGMMNSEW